MTNSIESAQGVFESLQTDLAGFSELSRILVDVAGIHLPPSAKNQCLMASRLGPILRNRRMQTYDEYLQFLTRAGKDAIQEFISALTTNTTHFFRESKHFDVLRLQIPQLLERKKKAKQNEIRIWCAAASTGQEPYTIAITLCEMIPELFSKWSVKFLATDIDQNVLERACEAIYSESEMASVPPLYKQKYFQSVVKKSGGSFQVREELVKMIRFAPFNLQTAKYPFQFPFDIIFCRNVLIYFKPTESQAVVQKLASGLAAGGCLFLGHSESGAMKSPLVTQIAPAVYQKISKSIIR